MNLVLTALAAFATAMSPLWLWHFGHRWAAIAMLVATLWALIAVSHNVEISDDSQD